MKQSTTDPDAPQKLRRALRPIGWNALLLLVGVVLIVAVGEAYLRLTVPFMTSSARLLEFVPKVGLVSTPDTELRSTNKLDFWTVSRVNSLGFLDREPPSPERAAAGCHIAMIGDSFVQARQVPVEDKFHVRLEELAARELPDLDVTTSAFGKGGIGQVAQLPFYDEYARILHPKLLVLVFAASDFVDNSPALFALPRGLDPDHLPYASTERGPDGEMKLLPPHPDYEQFRSRTPRPAAPVFWARAVTGKIKEISWFAGWLAAKWRALLPSDDWRDRFAMKMESFRERGDRHAERFEGWRLSGEAGDGESRAVLRTFAQADPLPPAFEDALDSTVFALEQFKERTLRDGAGLVILAAHGMAAEHPRIFSLMSEMAAASGIPVIDQAGYILRQGAELADAQWRHNTHWNVAGHRWAAEALLEWLKDNEDVCDGPRRH